MDDTSKKIAKLFNRRPDLGYRYFGFFADKENRDKKYLGLVKNSHNYILQEGIDEIYCSLADLNKEQIIHASGKVRIDKLDHHGIYNVDNQSYSSLF